MRSKAGGLPHVKSQASLVWELEEGRERVLRLPEKIVKTTPNLIIYRTLEEEVLLWCCLMKMAVPIDPISQCYMTIGLDLKLMRPKAYEQ
jgi:hypothetical protein